MERLRQIRADQHEAGSSTPSSSNPPDSPTDSFRFSYDNVHANGPAMGRSLSLSRSRSSWQSKTPRWWRIYLFSGMYKDISARAPYYWSDIRDAWDYRIIPATIYIFFANILPALAFSLDMFDRTHNSYGVNEVLLSSVLGAVVFSLFAAQPLTIVGVTGPITVFSYTVYDIITARGTNFFSFMALIGLWAMLFHWILAATNSCNGLAYVTRFSCDTFGFYVALIYLEKGVQVLNRQFAHGMASAYLSIMVALLVLIVAYLCGLVGESSLFQRHVRKLVEDYGTPLTIIFFTGFVHIGHMGTLPLSTLPTGAAFLPTKDRSWFIDFWKIDASDVAIAIPFAVILTILFWFDHNVSSLIAQGTEFPLRKPGGFHWDIFLLGLTTGVAGLLGIPFPNGLIPQAPFHTAALCVTRIERVGGGDSKTLEPDQGVRLRRVTDHVVEQRASNFLQGMMTLVLMTGPFLIVLGLVPQGVLAGLFFIMGVQALLGNGITRKLVYLCQAAEFKAGDALSKLPRQHMIAVFVAIELTFFGIAFAITQTIAAIGFPIILIIPIPVRAFLLPRIFTVNELAALDAPTASEFTMRSVGGYAGGISPLDAALTAEIRDEEKDEDAEREEIESGAVTGTQTPANEPDRDVSQQQLPLPSRGRPVARRANSVPDPSGASSLSVGEALAKEKTERDLRRDVVEAEAAKVHSASNRNVDEDGELPKRQ